MSPVRIAAACLITGMTFASAGAADDEPRAKTNPLFASDEILEVTITAPFTKIMQERSTEEDTPGQLAFVDAESGEVVLDVGIRTRGRYRQQYKVCPFAPLRLNFKKDQTKKTLFTKANKIKLVTHCKARSSRYSQGVLKEYLAYRIFNTITDSSFAVRLLRVNYVDGESGKLSGVNFAFLIEEDERLAKRLGLKLSKLERTSTKNLDGVHTNLASVFQYLIGNTDFSPIAGAQNETCCHNSVLLDPEGGPLLSVPYDFDMSGIVNAAYATPNPRFRLRSVRNRLYRGRCINNKHLDATLQTYRDHKDEIYALINDFDEMASPTKRYVSKFLDDFFATINNPKRVESRLRKDCV